MDSQPQSSQRSFTVRILRQDTPDDADYWQTFRLDHAPGLNMTSVLQKIASNPVTQDGQNVSPVAYDSNCLEEVCGACTMVINGRVRQACTALVDKLLEKTPEAIELRAMTKFPVVRDLIVDRRRLFRALEKLECWIPVDGYHDMGPGPKISQHDQEQAYPLSECMSCGCCLEACPQYTQATLKRLPEESDESFRNRENQFFDSKFIGAHANSQAVLMYSHPTGQMNKSERIESLIAEGGIQNCGSAGNCQAVCPKEIPLMTSWARSGRDATLHSIKKAFG